MTDYDRDRGAYSPSGEAPLAFDARQQTPRAGARPPFALIISALVLVILVLAVIFYYRSGVRHAGQPPVVGAPLGEMSAAAPASAQPEQEASGLQVYSAEQPSPGAAAPTFAPGPEQPLPRQAPPVAAPAAPAPSAVELRPAAPAPTAPPQTAAAAPPSAEARPAPPPPKPAPAPAKPAAAAAKPPAAAPAAAGGGAVQIGALASPALADKAWNDVAKKLPADMAGRTKRVEPVTTSTGATLYRAYIGGFDSKADAADFCAKLKAAGGVCIVR